MNRINKLITVLLILVTLSINSVGVLKADVENSPEGKTVSDLIIDENLAKAFAQKLGTDPLSQKQIDDLTYIVVPSELAHNVTSLTGIENFKNFK